MERCSSEATLCNSTRKARARRTESLAWSMSAQSATFTRTRRRRATAWATSSLRSSPERSPSSSGLPKGAKEAPLAWSLELVSASKGNNILDKAPLRIPRWLAVSSRRRRNTRQSSVPRRVVAIAASLAKASRPSRRSNCTRSKRCLNTPRGPPYSSSPRASSTSAPSSRLTRGAPAAWEDERPRPALVGVLTLRGVAGGEARPEVAARPPRLPCRRPSASVKQAAASFTGGFGRDRSPAQIRT